MEDCSTLNEIRGKLYTVHRFLTGKKYGVWRNSCALTDQILPPPQKLNVPCRCTFQCRNTSSMRQLTIAYVIKNITFAFCSSGHELLSF